MALEGRGGRRTRSSYGTLDNIDNNSVVKWDNEEEEPLPESSTPVPEDEVIIELDSVSRKRHAWKKDMCKREMSKHPSFIIVFQMDES